jgi:hypothetical protein
MLYYVVLALETTNILMKCTFMCKFYTLSAAELNVCFTGQLPFLFRASTFLDRIYLVHHVRLVRREKAGKMFRLVRRQAATCSSLVRYMCLPWLIL